MQLCNMTSVQSIVSKDNQNGAVPLGYSNAFVPILPVQDLSQMAVASPCSIEVYRAAAIRPFHGSEPSCRIFSQPVTACLSVRHCGSVFVRDYIYKIYILHRVFTTWKCSNQLKTEGASLVSNINIFRRNTCCSRAGPRYARM